jgi:hypothetical protein
LRRLDFLKLIVKTYPRRRLHVILDTYHTHEYDNSNQWLAKNSRITLDLEVLAEPRRGVLLTHHPSSDPLQILDNVKTRRSDQRVHRRRLQRPLPTLGLDQERRRDHPPRQP